MLANLCFLLFFCPSRLRSLMLMSHECLQETHNEKILKTSLMVTPTAYIVTKLSHSKNNNPVQKYEPFSSEDNYKINLITFVSN